MSRVNILYATLLVAAVVIIAIAIMTGVKHEPCKVECVTMEEAKEDMYTIHMDSIQFYFSDEQALCIAHKNGQILTCKLTADDAEDIDANATYVVFKYVEPVTGAYSYPGHWLIVHWE